MKTEEHQGDPLVINTIQLLAHKRALDRLLDMVETYKTAISSGELERMPPLAPPPHMPDVVPFIRLVLDASRKKLLCPSVKRLRIASEVLDVKNGFGIGQVEFL